MVRKTLLIKHSPPQGIPKLRHKEEKKKMIKLSITKLKTIDDSESLLFKSVLITNTIRKIKQMDFMETDFENAAAMEAEDSIPPIPGNEESKKCGNRTRRFQ
eukprot:TRINITY_DN23222_c0_g1_i1.p2 TRINITY_DN23222_c0_g1~~TRINITY_DN23222_c0_g1_i1.p2  ORF type:complete len:102 (-),score=31.95 TRINITY_DN23222_c0_g1_i1:102-407(-)